jgi:phosphoribosyl 1,2-cyclic phosphate phosphodiesterase
MARMTITFLGTGTSMGVPMIGCDCAVCTSSDPRDRRLRSSIYVETPESAWVVDTGPDFRTQALRARMRRLNAAIYTHAHTDHIMGLDDLRPFCFAGDLPMYASAETMTDLRRVYAFAFNGTAMFPGYVRPEPHVVTEDFVLGETVITPLPLLHGRFNVNGYLFSQGGEKLAAYMSDVKTVPDETLAKVVGVRTLIVDALRHQPHPTHMNIEEALAFVARVQPRETWFTHIAHELGHAATEATLPPNVRIAYDELKLEW